MRKLFICERPYMLYKSLIKAVMNTDDKIDLVLSNHMPGMEKMQHSIADSGLFESVFFYDDKLYREYTKEESLVDYVKFPNILWAWPKKMCRYISFHKHAKNVELPEGMIWDRYDEINVIDGVSTLNIKLNLDKVKYVVSEHCRNNFQYKMPLHQLAVRLSIILDRLNIVVAYSGCSKFVEAIEVSSDKNLVSYLKNKKIRVFDLSQAEKNLEQWQKKKLFDIYAQAYNMPSRIDGQSTLLLTTNLHADGYVKNDTEAEYVYEKIVENYMLPQSKLIVKPHPRDLLDYHKLFPNCIVVDPLISAEILALASELNIKRAVTTYSSAIGSFENKCECIKIGHEEKFNEIKSDIHKEDIK